MASPRIFCESLPVATAPYSREARVTFPRRQTAYRMRHCFARRIDECPVRRELLRTSTRSADRHPQGVCRIRKAAEPPTAAQQRIIEAEANRLAVLTRLCRAQVFSFRRHKSRSKSRLPIKSLSLGVPKGPFSFAKENGPFAPAARRRHIPPRRARKVVHPFAARKKELSARTALFHSAAWDASSGLTYFL